MGRTFTESKYTEWLNWYRANPGDIKGMSEHFKLHIKTAQKAWYRGWQYEWAPAMRDVLAKESLLRHTAAAEIEKQINTRVKEAVKERVDEALSGGSVEAMNNARKDLAMLKGAEASVLLRQNMMGKVANSGALNVMADKFAEMLLEQSKGKDINPGQIRANMRAWSLFCRDMAQDFEIVTTNKLRLLGQPTDIVRVEVGALTPEELKREAAQIQHDLELAAGGPGGIIDAEAVYMPEEESHDDEEEPPQLPPGQTVEE